MLKHSVLIFTAVLGSIEIKKLTRHGASQDLYSHADVATVVPRLRVHTDVTCNHRFRKPVKYRDLLLSVSRKNLWRKHFFLLATTWYNGSIQYLQELQFIKVLVYYVNVLGPCLKIHLLRKKTHKCMRKNNSFSNFCKFVRKKNCYILTLKSLTLKLHTGTQSLAFTQPAAAQIAKGSFDLFIMSKISKIITCNLPVFFSSQLYDIRILNMALVHLHSALSSFRNVFM